ncbi:MAG: hypothetical protein M1445_13645, partial [Bacteroidetes bacterium]|nr:hypothetical protein [Bacteroidota bacterium]
MLRTLTTIFGLLALVLVLSLPGKLQAQSLTSGNAVLRENTAYPTFPVNDPIFYFCAEEGVAIASLTAQSAGSTVSFLWEKFDPVALKFVNFTNETGTTSTQNHLSDGCYRVSFTENGANFQFRAWVLNGWMRPAAAITESTCVLLRLSSSVVGANYQYNDLSTGAAVSISSDYHFRWYTGTEYVVSIQNPTITQPPSKNTIYRVEVTDRAGCMKSAEVSYNSPVPVANFSWSTPQQNDP